LSFQGILRQFLQSTPGAIGAIFLDHDGESIDYWTERVFEIGPDGLRTIGAYQVMFWAWLGRSCKRVKAGKPQRLIIDYEHAKILSCVLKEDYYLVVIAEHDFDDGVLWRRVRTCRDRLLREL
jgi:predicted regulator of Ras-like GTPase activity (Roadblock/LC7/MglB family)